MFSKCQCFPHYWHRHNGNPRYLSSSIRASNTFLQAVVVPKDILIIGGSLAGLSIALELATIEGADRPRHITVLDAQDPTNHRGLTEFGKTNVASMAAAGMLAPMSERLPSGPLLDLCLKSRCVCVCVCLFALFVLCVQMCVCIPRPSRCTQDHWCSGTRRRSTPKATATALGRMFCAVSQSAITNMHLATSCSDAMGRCAMKVSPRPRSGPEYQRRKRTPNQHVKSAVSEPSHIR